MTYEEFTRLFEQAMRNRFSISATDLIAEADSVGNVHVSEFVDYVVYCEPYVRPEVIQEEGAYVPELLAIYNKYKNTQLC